MDEIESLGILLQELLQCLGWGMFLTSPPFQHLIRWYQDYEIRLGR